MESEAGSRVLIADADPVVRDQILRRLIAKNIFSDAVADGKEALEKLRGAQYALVLLDMSLPRVGVAPVLDYLSAVPKAERPVVLILDGAHAASSLDVDLVQIVLRKPCDLTQLSEIVGSCALAIRSTA